WSDNNSKKTWQFIGEMEHVGNFKVLFGKTDKKDNTSGETRAGLFKRITEVLWLEYFAIDPMTLRDRTKNKYDSLVKKYKAQVARLQQTGGGVNPNEPEEDEYGFPNPNRYWIAEDGPKEDTPAHAKNLWDDITQKFEFFPRLHRL
ncbi:hypothetical protein BOTBODRAFT_90196, partial [Botryobasidium botryosum FD-172 SS1]